MIIGHQDIIKQLDSALFEERLPHALLFNGISGIGKCLLAKQLAKKLLCLESLSNEKGELQACGVCNSCLTFDSGNHPDYYFLNANNKESVSAGNVRDLLKKLTLKSFGGKGKVLIIEQAEKIGMASFNILLKFLEEPQANTYIILVSSNLSLIPITIRSRCQNYNFKALSANQIQEIINLTQLKEDFSNPQELESLSQIAEGSLEFIYRVKDNIELWRDVKLLVKNLCMNKVDIYGSFLAKFLKKTEASSKSGSSLNSNDFSQLQSFIYFLPIVIKQEIYNDQSAAQRYNLSLLLQDSLLADYYLRVRNLDPTAYFNALFTNFQSKKHLEIEDYLP